MRINKCKCPKCEEHKNHWNFPDCEECKEILLRRKELRGLRKTGEIDKFNCEKCKARFSNEDDNREHTRMKHEYECEQCGKRDMQETKIEQHIKKTHEENEDNGIEIIASIEHKKKRPTILKKSN